MRDLRVLAFAEVAAEDLGEVRAIDLADEDAPLVAQRGFQRVPGRPRGLAILAAPPPTTKCVFPSCDASRRVFPCDASERTCDKR